jgi:hypothetical protein
VSAYVEGVGVIAPGLRTWEQTRSVLRGELPYEAAAVAPRPALLPPNERRRAPLAVLLALDAAGQATTASGMSATQLPSVFASADADMNVIHRISAALAEPARQVSPTDFHNSVHNAAAGYWGIAAQAQPSATTLAANDVTTVAGFREAFAMLATDDRAVLLVLYDVPPPVPLYEKRPIETPCGIALVLSREPTERSLAHLSMCDAGRLARLDDAGLERLRGGNPAARSLPLLAAIAAGADAVCGLHAEDDRVIGIRVTPGVRR